jgi:predicted TIM-barrel fold metal-dependent hydrolase
VVAPGTPVIDAHVHVWDPRQFRLPWLDGEPHLNQAFGLPADVPVDAFVYVQVDTTPAYGLLEARQAVEDARLAGVVAWAPLEDGPIARTYLDALVRLGPKVKGVRRLIEPEPDTTFPLRLIDALRLLPEYGLTFDICIKHHQLPAVIEMVRACPQTQFVLDHLGKPAALDPWREHLAQLAAQPNVVAKLSGLLTEVADPAPYIAHALDVFGPDRLMFGSDWPVLTKVASYEHWLSVVEACVAATARNAIWSATARRVYRV